MPLIRISVHDTTPIATRRVIADSVYDAMRATLGIPEHDRFMVLTAHGEGELYIDPTFQGMQRTEKFVLVHITMRSGRSVETKQAFYAELSRLLKERASIPPDDLMVVTSENGLADWSFGRGEAQYVTNPPPPVK